MACYNMITISSSPGGIIFDLALTFFSPQGSARKLVKAALKEAAKKREMRYSDLKQIERGVRRHFHDDITVIVLYLDSNLISSSPCNGPMLSVRGGGGISMGVNNLI